MPSIPKAYHGNGWKVVGIRNGTAGLLSRPVEAEALDERVMSSEMLRQGGTIPGTTNKGNPFRFPTEGGKLADRSADVIDGYRQLGLDALIAIGGDGSMEILRRLAQQGVAFPGRHPKDHRQRYRPDRASIGFGQRCRRRPRPWIICSPPRPPKPGHGAGGHGTDAGHIALTAGIAGGADVILIPEIPLQTCLNCLASRPA